MYRVMCHFIEWTVNSFCIWELFRCAKIYNFVLLPEFLILLIKNNILYCSLNYGGNLRSIYFNSYTQTWKYLNINKFYHLSVHMPLKSGGFSFLGLVYHTVFTHKEYGNKYVGLRHDSNMATLIIILMSTHDMAHANLCQ